MSQFTPDADWLHWHQSPSKPSYVPPAGAVDAHCHVFGPGDLFPFAPERKYTPCDASKDQLWALRDYLGFSRNVIVQATCHGADNRALVDALNHSNGLARGVATVKASVTDKELAALHAAGVRGVRFNFVKPEFELFVKLLRENENFWSKVTCPERLSLSGAPTYDDFVPFGRRIVELFPDRVLWGTDWPHPNMKSHMPDDGHLVDMIPRIAPTAELQQKLLVANPMRLYWSD